MEMPRAREKIDSGLGKGTGVTKEVTKSRAGGERRGRSGMFPVGRKRLGDGSGGGCSTGVDACE